MPLIFVTTKPVLQKLMIGWWHIVSEGQIVEIYNQGISQVIGVIKELSNVIKTLNSQVETLSKDKNALECIKSVFTANPIE